VAVEHSLMRNKPEPSPLQQALVDIAVAEDYSQRGARLVADVAVRRWRSFHRRHRRKSATLEDRVRDLARGLRERLLEHPIYEEPGHFLRLARRLADVLVADERREAGSSD
jgi:hypothetical protein